MTAWRHMTDLWPKWTLAPVLPFWFWVAFMTARGDARWDHIAVAILATALAYGTSATKRLFLGLFPLGLVGLSYDAMRFVQHLGVSESTVHVCDLRAIELRWFGFDAGGTRVTLHDWLQAHATTWLDIICAIPYGTFLLVVIGYTVFLFIRDFRAQQRFAWGFLALNLAGFVTYHLYPAAPPWYFHHYGCTVDLAARASAGPNLARVDALLGVPYFAGVYGRASDVFGAVPSLHVAYPMLMMAVGWRVHRTLGRGLLALFFVWMCFSAVYLDHHWVADIVVGSAYALFVAMIVLRWSPVAGTNAQRAIALARAPAGQPGRAG
jgi:membrane-associated phospholipid phosphatase